MDIFIMVFFYESCCIVLNFHLTNWQYVCIGSDYVLLLSRQQTIILLLSNLRTFICVTRPRFVEFGNIVYDIFPIKSLSKKVIIFHARAMVSVNARANSSHHADAALHRYQRTYTIHLNWCTNVAGRHLKILFHAGYFQCKICHYFLLKNVSELIS